MSKAQNLITSCLNEMNSQEFKDTYESLVNLTNYLEEKNDPDPDELAIVEYVYQMIEKMKLLEGVLRKKVSSIDDKNAGGILKKLYERPINGNTSVMFK
jgi:hypothetical protein